MLPTHNIDAVCRTDRLTHHAGHAAGGTILAPGQPMQGPQSGGEGPPFLRVLIGHASPQMPDQAEAMSDVNEKVSKEMAGRQAKGLQDLQDVDSFPKCEVSLNLFNGHLIALSDPQQNQSGDQDIEYRERQHDRPSQSHQVIPPESGQGPANQHHEETEYTHLE